MPGKNINCIHCNNPLTGKQEKYCSERCRKRVNGKKQKKKYWRKIHSIIKYNKIKSKVRRKMLIEQEIKRREEMS